MTNIIKIYCTTIKNLNLLNKLPNYIIPFGLGDNNYPSNWLSEINGDSIFTLNKYFGEATGMYWVWKNEIKNFSKNDWIGFCQHRRLWLNDLFEKKQYKNTTSLYSNLLNPQNKIFLNADSILLQPTIFRKQTLLTQFNEIYGDKIIENCVSLMNDPVEKIEFIKYLNLNSLSICNMFITKPEIFEQYCKSIFLWIFKCYDYCNKEKLLKGRNLRLPIFLIERYTSFWFHRYTNPKYLSFARLGNFFLSNAVNNFLNPLKLPFTFRNYPTIHYF